MCVQWGVCGIWIELLIKHTPPTTPVLVFPRHTPLACIHTAGVGSHCLEQAPSHGPGPRPTSALHQLGSVR